MYILDEKELLPFTFRFIDLILNNLDNNKFRKKKAFDSVKSFAKLRGFDIGEDVYTFKINDKSFIVAFINNEFHIPIQRHDLANYFHLDKYYYNDNKLIYLFLPADNKYYSYENNNLDNIIHSTVRMIQDNNLFGVDIFNEDINTTLRFELIYVVITLVLYFTLEDNKDTKKEAVKFIMNYYYNNLDTHIIEYDDIYDDLFKDIENILGYMTDSEKEQIITKNYLNILNKITDYIVPGNYYL